eukprot:1104481-Rhodomonas_salina.2
MILTHETLGRPGAVLMRNWDQRNCTCCCSENVVPAVVKVTPKIYPDRYNNLSGSTKYFTEK